MSSEKPPPPPAVTNISEWSPRSRRERSDAEQAYIDRVAANKAKARQKRFQESTGALNRAVEKRNKEIIRRNAEILDPAYHAIRQERAQERDRRWNARLRAAANLSAAAAHDIRLRLQREQATPKWANRGRILAIYRSAAALSKSTGIPHEVQHIEPLLSLTVCGLHCEANLRVVKLYFQKT